MSPNKKRPNAKVMVINGSGEVLDLFREILETAPGRRFSCFLYALADEQHVEKMRTVQPDVVLIDQPFRDRDLQGWELVQKIRLARDLRHIPIIFMTTNVRLLAELSAQLMSLNVRSLLKPFDPDHLLTQIEEALEVAAEEGTETDE